MKSYLKKIIALTVLWIFIYDDAWTQDSLPRFFVITTDTVVEYNLAIQQYQILPDKTGKFTIDQVKNSTLSKQFFSLDKKPAGIDTMVHTTWFRYRVMNGLNKEINISLVSSADESDFYVFRNNNKPTHYKNGFTVSWNDKDGLPASNMIPLKLAPGEQVSFYYRRANDEARFPSSFKLKLVNTEKYALKQLTETQTFIEPGFLLFAMFAGFCLLGSLFNFFLFIIDKQKVHLYFSLFLISLALIISPLNIIFILRYQPGLSKMTVLTTGWLFILAFIQFIRHYFQTFINTPRLDRFLLVLIVAQLARAFAIYNIIPGPIDVIVFNGALILSFLFSLYTFYRLKHKNVKPFSTAILPFAVVLVANIAVFFLQRSGVSIPELVMTFWVIAFYFSIGWPVLYFTWILFKQYDRQKREIIQHALDAERMAKEKEIERSHLVEQQKVELERTVQERTTELRQSIEDLQVTQKQLVQSEKMASLGELTAGIAHEIQNPLNFVNNFSEVNKELTVELAEEIEKGNYSEAKAIAKDIRDNEEKINHHGKRADAIVKGMLQHSRSNSGAKEPSDINALADEYLRLSYHGLRAKDKSFNATLKTDYDETIGSINIIPQDIGRVILNLINNAFYAVNEKTLSAVLTPTAVKYEPTVSVSTKKIKDKIEITVKDNGNGIPRKVLDKIFQPFFTTKPTGQGTGLGLSLSYDIVKVHGGELKVETTENNGSIFIIELPATA